ncbi:ficolin-1-like [Saccostrea cucullata]|uniref:ficolin-1-like n=1 Tax=Saccostrea cuccullata TaxID=36930 RepID=UPI002ED43618
MALILKNHHSDCYLSLGYWSRLYAAYLVHNSYGTAQFLYTLYLDRSHGAVAGDIPIDCKELHTDGHTRSGVYEIYPYGTITSPVRVYCDMHTMGGGWTAIQKRVNGSLNFVRNWTEYKNGFGTPEQDIWVGNDIIHQLSKEKISSLYVSITLLDGTTLYEKYGQFSVANETEKYQLFLAGLATGTLGDSMLDTGHPDNFDLSGMYFSTPETDNDRNTKNC